MLYRPSKVEIVTKKFIQFKIHISINKKFKKMTTVRKSVKSNLKKYMYIYTFNVKT